MTIRPILQIAGVVALALLLAGTAAAQSAGDVAPLRTAHGHPDLGGVWDFRTVTPLERPEELGDQAFFSEEESAEYAAARVLANNADLNREQKKQVTTDRGLVNGTRESRDLALAYNNFWWDRGDNVVGTRRTSLVIDPPNGRVPPLTEAGAQRAAERLRINQSPTEGPEDRPLGERCITGFNSGPPMLPAAYNMNVQIFQTRRSRGAAQRDGAQRPDHPPRRQRPWHVVPLLTGDSRGHWDGDTLVVETKNYPAGDQLPELRARTSTSSNGFDGWTRTRCSTALPSRTRPPGRPPGRSSCRCGAATCRFSSTPATRATTAWTARSPAPGRSKGAPRASKRPG